MKKTKTRISLEKEAEFEMEKDLVFFLNASERHAYLTIILVVLFLAIALPRLEWPRDVLGWVAYALVAIILLAAVANAALTLKEKGRLSEKGK
ncbi:MAG: hypothetical protein QXH27_04590 [Candidatus Micrarchaeia archaeon]